MSPNGCYLCPRSIQGEGLGERGLARLGWKLNIRRNLQLVDSRKKTTRTPRGNSPLPRPLSRKGRGEKGSVWCSAGMAAPLLDPFNSADMNIAIDHFGTEWPLYSPLPSRERGLLQ